MANEYFVVKNGLEVGSVTIDATTGNLSIPEGSSLTIGSTTITGSGVTNLSAINKNDTSVVINDTGTGSNVDVIVDGQRAVVITGTAILPRADKVYDLGSPDLQWRDVFVGPGSLYVDGQKVLQADNGNIVVSCDPDQNLIFQTTGSGNLELDPTGSGVVIVKAPLQIEGGSSITSTDGMPINFGVNIKTDAIQAKTTNADLILAANGTGSVRVNDDFVVNGNITVTGTTTTINTATLSVADNIIDLNSDFTVGTPTENAGIRVMRGDEAAVQIRWNETTNRWTITNDGSTYVDIPTSTSMLVEGTNLYYTDARARAALSASNGISYNSTTGAFTGSYVAGTGITISGATISMAQSLSSADSPTFAGATLTGPLTSNSTASFTTVTANLTGNVTGNVTGNAGTATKLATARTISLGGDVSGSASFDGTTNVTITATVADDSHTHTSAFITDATSANTANMIVKRGAAGEISAGAISANSIVTTGSVTIGGTLTVNGASTTINAATLDVSDLNITVAKGAATATAANGAGLTVDGAAATLTYTSVDDRWNLNKNLNVGTVYGALSGNASTATTLQTARTISLGGDLTGSVSFNGSSDVTLTATVAANSVALGTDTTGNYVASIANGSYLTGADGGSEGAALTLSVDATSANTASKVVARDASGNFSAGTITAALTGNASTATKLATARTLSLSGDASGSVSFDGSANADIAVVVADNSHNHTSANISDATNAATANMIVKRDASGGFIANAVSVTTLTTSGDATIGGNLTVNGVTATVNATTLDVADLNVTVAKNAATAAAANGAGLTVNGPTVPATLTYTSSNDRWAMNKDLTVGTVFGALSGNSSTADKLSTARTITLSGDVTGSVSFDGSANATITTTVAANSVALGTDTTGNYVGTGAVSGNGLSGSATGEGSTFTVTSNATSANTANTIVYRDASGNFTAGTITAALTGNATSSDKLSTARTIALSGDVTGSVTFDGSANATITTTIAADSVALGTDTTGNYVASISNGSYLTGANGGTEGAALTLGVDATSLNTASKVVARDASGNFSAGTITASLSGNASTATALQTARTIALSGDVTGSVTFDGSANATITTTIAADSVALGTDTTGNYVAVGAVSGNGLSGSASAEGATFTVTSNATALNTANTIVFRDASGNFAAGTITANLTGAVTGNASTATKLATARTLSLSGDATGSATFDGSANADIVVTVADNSHNHTSANISDATSANTANMIVKRGASGEVAVGAVTAASVAATGAVSGASVAATGAITGATLTTTGDVTVGGNLTVNGLTATINATTLDVDDLNVTVAKGAATAAAANGAGLTVDGAAATITYTSADDRWNLNKNLNVGTVYGALSGNASTASALQTTRYITLTGDVTGNVAFNGSGDAAMTATIAANSVALGTDTTGNYVASIANGSYITGGGAGSEGAALTLAVDATSTNTASKVVARDASGNFSAGTITAALSGNASTATALQTARYINGVAFDGTANITVGSSTTNSVTFTNTGGAAIGSTFNGGSALTVSYATVGAAASSHTHLSADITDATNLSTANMIVKRDASGNFSAGTITAALTGNASTASKWATARTITLGGDLTGNVSIDGSANATLTATIAANSVALGTDTSGNYVASITNGSYLTGANGGSAGAALTLAVDATSANTASKVVARDASGNFSAGTITAALTGNVTGNVTGNADTATKLATARVITLGGDLTGNVSFDGSSNVTLTATVAADSVALGTDTTGNYVASITNGSYLTGANGGSEGAALTLAVDATSANTASKVVARDASGGFSAGAISAASVTTTGDITVGGNLTVSGATTTINAATLTVADLNVVVASGAATAAAANGAGVTVNGANATFTYTSADDRWNLNKALNVSTVYGALSGNASTATTLQTARNINGVSFNGSADITVTANTTNALTFNTTGGAAAGSTFNGSAARTIDYSTVGAAAASHTHTSAQITDATNLNTASMIVKRDASGNFSAGTITANLTGNVTGNATNITAYTINQNVGTANSPTFAGLSVPSITHTGTTGVGDIGSASQMFGTVYATASAAKYADVAENYVADAAIEAGTVVHFGGEKEVAVCDEDHCTAVAGIVSTAPAYLMNSQCEGEFVVPVAFTGRVPCKVVGKVRKGDLMVSAGNGAARAEANPKIGAVIGKALENFDGEAGVIEVVVGR